MADLCFVASGPVEWGSARMRCYWPAAHIDGAVVVNWQEYAQGRASLPPAAVYIWQKYAHLEAVRQRPNARHIWDLCDPLHWFSPVEAEEIVEQMDGFTASSAALAADLSGWLNGEAVQYIPDAFEPRHFQVQRQHETVRPVRLIWYGVAVNRVGLYAAVANLHRLQASGRAIELTIMDDRPEQRMPEIEGLFPVYHVRWSLAHENATLAAHDIALTPPYPGPWGLVKSDNKQLTAALCGLPAWDGLDYERGRQLVEHAGTRQEMADQARGRALAQNAPDVARQWVGLLENELPENDYAAYWDRHAESRGPVGAVTAWDEATYQEFYRNVLRHIPGPRRYVADVGCGPALIRPVIKDMWPAAIYEGHDVSRVMVEAAEDRHPDCKFYLTNGQLKLSFGVDLVLCHSVFTHIRPGDAAAYLRQMAGVLGPGGMVSASVHVNETYSDDYSRGIECIYYAPGTFEQMANEAGLVVEGHVDMDVPAGVQRFYRLVKP